MSSLVDIIGNPNYRPLTAQSLKNLERRYASAKEKAKLRTLSRVSMLSILEEEEEAEANIPDVELLDGKPAPTKLGIFTTKLYGKPIEELDNARLTNRTFNVVGRRFKSSSIYRFSSTRSCYIFSPINPLRKFTIWLLTNQFFDIAVMVTILSNCVFLALDEPRFPLPGENDIEPAYLTISEYVFTALYSCEMLIKIIARGFVVEKFTYLRDPWNWLDSGVILLAYVTIVLGVVDVDVGNFSGLRTFRVLRALKTISVVPGLKSIINALLRSTKMLAEVLLLTIFVLAIFALLALQLFMGVLRHKCVLDYDITVNNDSEVMWYIHSQDEGSWYHWDGNPVVCSNISGSGPNGWSGCPPNFTCLPHIGNNPNFGYTNFDNFGWAMITSFQLITLDYWENVYNLIIRGMGPWSIFFFFMTVMFGSFYLINLMLAVVAMAYTEEMENQGKQKQLEVERQKKQNILEMDAEKLRKIAERKRKKLEKLRQQKAEAVAKAAVEAAAETAVEATAETAVETAEASAHVNDDTDNKQLIVTKTTHSDNVIDTVSRLSEHQNLSSENADESKCMDEDAGQVVFITSSQNGSQHKDNDDNDEDDLDPDESRDQSPVECPCKLCCKCCRANFLCLRSAYRRMKKLQYYSGYVILDPLADLFITVCIGINTLFLALDHSTVSGDMKTVLSIGNLIFTGIFTIECVMKIVALDKRYFKSSWNIFDMFIVIISLVEIPLQQVKSLSALRTFRLLRVLKLAQSWTTMRTLISIIGSTVGAIANISIVLIIIIYIFAIIGMQLFGKDYTPENFREGEVPRWHFRDFTHSVLMVFRILCGEWIEPLYDCMRASDTGSCIAVFISTYFCGNIMILNLFLALLLNSFASDSLKTKTVKVSRLVIAVDKLKHWFWMAIGFCTCRQRKGKRCSTENKKENESNLKPGSLMVVDDNISQILKVTTIEMERVKSIIGDQTSTFTVRKMSLTSSNESIVHEQSNTSSATNIKNDGRPKSHAIFRDSAIQGVTMSSQVVENFTVSSITGVYNGNVHDGGIQNRSVQNGNFQNGSVQNKSVHSGSVHNGSVHNGSLQNESIQNGSVQNENVHNRSMHNGSANNGSVQNGCVHDGSVHNGSVQNGSDQNRSIQNGNVQNESSQNRSVHSGIVRDSVINISTVFDTNEETGEQEKVSTSDDNDDTTESNDGKIMPTENGVKDCFPQIMNDYFKLKCPCLCCKNPEESAITDRWHSFRSGVCLFVDHRFFEWFILIIIAASSITLTFEDIHIDSKPRLRTVLYWLNVSFAILFTVEMMLKWIGMGFKQYFTNFWCWLDFFIVLVALLSLVAFAIGLSGLSAFRALRTLRALRPLRAISRWQGMKIVVNALVHAIPSIINVVLVILVFWLIFSIVGVQFFGGTFFKCLDADGLKITNLSLVNNKTDCLSRNLTWKNSDINFDHVMNGYIALFQVATFEGWIEIMEDAVDARGADQQPFREASIDAYIFFVIFIVFGAFFTLNLFIGVIIDNFSALKRKYEGDSSLDMFLTSNQKKYYQTMRRLGTKKPTKQIKLPENRIRLWFFNFTNSTIFEVTVVVIILLNMVTMMIDHYIMAESVTIILDLLNIVFTTIFGVECIFKMIGLGIYYFQVPWNLFDFIIVFLSFLGIILKDALANAFINPTLLRVLRIFRIGRVLRLVKSAKGLRKLLFALFISLPALLNIGALLTLIIFIFSIVGMSQFGYVKHGGSIDDVVNFETWVNSMMLLFRVATSAGWNDVLYPLMKDREPDCDPHYMNYENGNCGNKWFAICFFFLFLVVSFLVIINMYIAVILENFSHAHAQEEVGITEDDFGMFYQIWETYDPQATQFIEYEQLSDFCDNLEHPLRLAKPNHIKIAGLDLPIYEDTKLHCLEVLFALTRRVLGDVEESKDFKDLQAQMSEKFAEAFPDRKNHQPTTTTMEIKKRLTACKILQRAYRLYRLKKEISKASNIYRQHKCDVATSSSASSKRPSMAVDGDRPGASCNKKRSATLLLPGQLGISRTPTPATPENNPEESSSSINCNVKSKAYRVANTSKHSIATVNIENESQVTRRHGKGDDVEL